MPKRDNPSIRKAVSHHPADKGFPAIAKDSSIATGSSQSEVPPPASSHLSTIRRRLSVMSPAGGMGEGLPSTARARILSACSAIRQGSLRSIPAWGLLLPWHVPHSLEMIRDASVNSLPKSFLGTTTLLSRVQPSLYTHRSRWGPAGMPSSLSEAGTILFPSR